MLPHQGGHVLPGFCLSVCLSICLIVYLSVKKNFTMLQTIYGSDL